MKSFLSFLRKLDSSTRILRNQVASNQQLQSLPSWFKNSQAIDKSIRTVLPGISLSLYTSLLTIGTSIGIGITFNPQRSWAGSTCVGTYSSRSGVTIDASGAVVTSATNSVIGYFNSITNSYVPLVNYTGGNNINAIATQPSTGNLYFVNRTTGKVIVFNVNTSAQTTLSGSIPISFTAGTAIIGATFNTSGKLYVYYSDKKLIEVDPTSGAQIGSTINISGIPGGGPPPPATIANGATLTGGTTNGDIAIGTDGVIYILGDTSVTNTAGVLSYTSRLYKLTISGTTATATDVVASNISGLSGSAANGLAIDPATGKFYISSSLGTYELNPTTNTANQLTTATGTGDLAACGSPAPDLPTIIKAFAPNNVVGTPANSTLTLTLGNTNQVPIYLISTLTDNFQTGLTVRSPNGLGGTCLADIANSNKVTAATNSSSISLLNGLKVRAGGCTVTVNVTASTAGTFTNTIAAGELKTTAGNNQDSTTDTLIVVPGDYGDAPITGTAPIGMGTNAYGEAIHGVVSGIKLGTTIDAETTSIANATASGDGADDDGISSFPPLTAGATSYSIPAANITATGTGTLHAWIDFNKNGTFDAGEYTSVAVANNTLAGALNWAGITAGDAGNTFARFRFTSDPTITAITPSGTAADGEVEDYLVNITALSLSGRIFEDVNYGGGAGRSLAGASGVGINGARVELYGETLPGSGTYTFVAATTTTTVTGQAGSYSFTGVKPINYRVRVVNNNINRLPSTRPGDTTTVFGLQTFRLDAATSTVTAVTGEVGGRIPTAVNDAVSVNTVATAFPPGVLNWTPATIVSSNITGIDFGFNFDTIVNTNDAGQGSLRQFITNSNTLTNVGLDQVPNLIPAPGSTAIDPAAGVETSIFMIPVTGINGTGGNANAAVINLASNLIITDAKTSVDATTQTINVGDSNSGSIGTGGTVGVDGLSLSTIPKPEIVLNLQSVPVNTNAIKVSGASTILKGFAIYGYRSTTNLGTLLNSAILIQPGVTDAGAATVTQLLGGTMANGSDPGVPPATIGHTFQTAGAANIFNNYLAYNADAISFENTNGTTVNFINNELFSNGPKDNNGVNVSGIYADQMETVAGTKNITIRGNLVRNSSKPSYPNAQGQGLQITYSTFVTVVNNTFSDNNVYGVNAAASDTLIQKNIVTGTKNIGLGQGSGITVQYGGGTGLRNRISQNSIYQNAKLGIDHQFDGVTPNDGAVNNVQANNGMDYPIITSSAINGGNLTVKGYVGNVPAGSTTFANAILEFFIADNDGNNDGKVFSSDPATVSKPHGEGRTYINTCSADGNGLFNCTFVAPTGFTNTKNITATATDLVGNTSEFSSVPAAKAKLLLVKRVTAINADSAKNPNDNNIRLDQFVDDTTSLNQADDNHCNWLGANGSTGACTNSYTIGAVAPGKVKPGDEIEYTVYYLNSGENKAGQARICDRLDANLTFQTQFDINNATTVGKGIGLVKGNSLIQHLTNIGTDSDKGELTTAALATGCNLTANVGTNLSDDVVVVDVGDTTNPLMGSVGAGTPTTSYGYVRLKVKVK
jgi:GEVED domain